MFTLNGVRSIFVGTAVGEPSESFLVKRVHDRRGAVGRRGFAFYVDRLAFFPVTGCARLWCRFLDLEYQTLLFFLA